MSSSEIERLAEREVDEIVGHPFPVLLERFTEVGRSWLRRRPVRGSRGDEVREIRGQDGRLYDTEIWGTEDGPGVLHIFVSVFGADAQGKWVTAHRDILVYADGRVER